MPYEELHPLHPLFHLYMHFISLFKHPSNKIMLLISDFEISKQLIDFGVPHVSFYVCLEVYKI